MKTLAKIAALTASLCFSVMTLSAQVVDSVWVRMVNDSSLVVAAPVTLQEPSQAILDSLVREAEMERLRVLAERDSLDRVVRNVLSLKEVGEGNMRCYYFQSAKRSFEEALSICPEEETALREELEDLAAQSRFAVDNTREIPELRVLARARFKEDEFFLFYPLPDNSWRLQSDRPAVYYDGEEEEIHISRDATRYYEMTFGDRLYFASRDLPGFGGLDLYYCDWDEALGEWGEPRNMGFPFSSQDDDFLLVEDGEGNLVFSSIRDCEQGEVAVYVVKPTGNTISSPLENRLESLSVLEPQRDTTAVAAELEAINAQILKVANRLNEIQDIMDVPLSEEEYAGFVSVQAKLKAEKEELEKRFIAIDQGIMSDLPEGAISVEGSYDFVRKHFGPPVRIIFIED